MGKRQPGDSTYLGPGSDRFEGRAPATEKMWRQLFPEQAGRVRTMRILQAQGIMGDKEAQRILNEEQPSILPEK